MVDQYLRQRLFHFVQVIAQCAGWNTRSTRCRFHVNLSESHRYRLDIFSYRTYSICHKGLFAIKGYLLLKLVIENHPVSIRSGPLSKFNPQISLVYHMLGNYPKLKHLADSPPSNDPSILVNDDLNA